MITVVALSLFFPTISTDLRLQIMRGHTEELTQYPCSKNSDYDKPIWYKETRNTLWQLDNYIQLKLQIPLCHFNLSRIWHLRKVGQ